MSGVTCASLQVVCNNRCNGNDEGILFCACAGPLGVGNCSSNCFCKGPFIATVVICGLVVIALLFCCFWRCCKSAPANTVVYVTSDRQPLITTTPTTNYSGNNTVEKIGME
jgi:hypothetical protein